MSCRLLKKVGDKMSMLHMIDNHQVYKEIEDIKTQILILINKQELIESLDDESRNILHRCHLVIQYLSTTINSTDSYLLIEEDLNELKIIIDKVKEFINEEKFLENITTDYKNLNMFMDRILKNSVFIPLLTKDGIEDIREAASSFRRSIGMQKSNLEKEINKLNEESNNLNDEITDMRDNLTDYEEEIDNWTVQFEDIFSKCEEEVSDLENKVQNKMLELEEYQNNLNKKFLEKQSERSESFDNLKTNLKESFGNFLQVNKENFDNELSDVKNFTKNFEESFYKEKNDLIESFKMEQENFISVTKTKQIEYDKILEEHKVAVEQLLGKISTTSIAGHHKKVADSAMKSARTWQIFTMISFAITAGFSVYSLLFQEITTLSWPDLVAKFFAIASLGSLTAYTARQAKINQELAYNNRNLEVELKTLDPYIAIFNSQDQELFKKELFPKIFGRNNENKALSGKEYDNFAVQFIEKLMNAIDKREK